MVLTPPIVQRALRLAKQAAFRLLPARAVNALMRWNLPHSAQLEVTTACNLSCPLCTTHDTARGVSRLSFENVKEVVRGCGRSLKVVSLHVLGEPLVHAELFDFIRHCEAHGVRATFSTNGMLLGRHIDDVLDSGLSLISIAIDGADEADYAKYRLGGDFHTVVRNAKALVEAKRARGATRPTIQVQMVMFSYNEDREAEARAFLEGLGADVVSLKRPAYLAPASPAARSFWDKVDMQNETRRWPRPETRASRLYRNQRMCPQLERATVLSDGSVVACCIDAEGHTAFGNLNRQDFRSIWRGEAHRSVIDQFMKHELPTCHFCTLGDTEAEPPPPAR